jgi:PleD family two-component response regulator
MAEHVLVIDGGADGVGPLLERGGYEVMATKELPGALEVLAGADPEVVVIDLRLAGLDGFAACSELRRRARTPGLGIIVLTETSSARERVAGLSAGADDWLAKPVEDDELLARVGALVRRSRELRSRSRLTGLPGAFDLDVHLATLVSHGGDFALALVDIDRLASFNRAKGFEEGDRLIADLGHLIHDVVLDSASALTITSHLGGDHFGLLIDPDVAGEVLDDLVDRFDSVVLPRFHTDDELAAGVFSVPQRVGEPLPTPVVALSVGVATTAHRRLGSAGQAIAVATELRVLAKASTSSAWQIDRRRS